VVPDPAARRRRCFESFYQSRQCSCSSAPPRARAPPARGRSPLPPPARRARSTTSPAARPFASSRRSLRPGTALEIDVTHDVEAAGADAGGALVRGRIVSARPRLSADGTGIYTEFVVAIVEVLDARGVSLAPGDFLAAGRLGGRLVLPGGRSVTFRSEPMPAPGPTYVLRLRRAETGEFTIVDAAVGAASLVIVPGT
jgi:hypothetical protein